MFHTQFGIICLSFNGLVFKLENLFIHEIDDYTCQAIHNIWLSLNLIRMKSVRFCLCYVVLCTCWEKEECKGFLKWEVRGKCLHCTCVLDWTYGPNEKIIKIQLGLVWHSLPHQDQFRSTMFVIIYKLNWLKNS